MQKIKKLKNSTISEIENNKTVELAVDRLADIFVAHINEENLSKDKDSSDPTVGN